MKTYNIQVPFPEEMTQADYDTLYSQQVFWKHFDTEEYECKCEIIDKEFDKLIKNKQQEIFIEYKDIPQYFNINYLKTKVELLRARGLKILESQSGKDYGYYFSLGDDNNA